MANNQNSKKANLRNYDENPIVIKDELSNAKFLSIVFLIILFSIFIIRKLFFSQYDTIYHSNSTIVVGVFLTIMNFKNIFRNFEKDAIIYFYHDYVVKKLENGIEKKIKISDLKYINKTISSMLPNDFIGEKLEKFILTCGGIFFIFVLALAIYRGKFEIPIFISLFTFTVLYLPQFFMHRKYGGIKDSFYDVVWLQDKDGKFFNFMISSDKQYNEIKKYLMVKTGKSLDKVEKKFFLSVSWFKDKDLIK